MARALVALAGMWLFAASPAQAEWRRAQSDHFILYSEASERELRAKAVQLEIFHDLLEMLTGTPDADSPNKLPIYYVRGRGEMSIIRTLPQGAAGFYAATPEGILAVVDTTARNGSSDNQILFHEYAHHFMHQYRPGAYPAWWVEGFAEFVMTARIEPGFVEYGNYNAGRMRMLRDRAAWIGMDDLVFGGRPERSADVTRFYAQSWLLVHYLFNDEDRSRALLAYLGALGRGEEPRQAFAAAFGTDLRTMEQALRVYPQRMSYTRIGRAAGAPEPRIEIMALPASADALLLPQATLRIGAGPSYRAGLLERIRTGAQGAADPFAQRVLAHAETLYGDAAAGEAILERLLAQYPRDAELLYLEGMRHLRAGREDGARRGAHFRAARQWFARAHEADPSRFQTLFRYAEAHGTEPASEDIANILLLARQLAPQVESISLAAGGALLALGRYDDAAAVLTPVAVRPHGGSSAQRARLMLGRARARAPATEPAGFEEQEEGE